MDIFKKTKELCQLYNIKPARSRGQNFLIRESVYDDIVDIAELDENDVVLEVGPGLGFLTQKIAERVKKVVTVELDEKLVEVLKINLQMNGVKNVEVVNMNVLDFDPSVLGTKKYKIVANLPYNITSVFLRKFLSKVDNKPESIILMLQKEVVERIVAKPPKMSLLAVSVQYYAKAKLAQYVPKEDFFPSPEVDSAIIEISEIESSQKDERDFFRLVKFGFSSKRKMLKNNLAGCLQLSQDDVVEKIKRAGFGEKVRAQELSVEDWKVLKRIFIRG